MKDFIPKPQALELKELGFDEPCIAFYSDNDIPKAIDQRWGSSVQTISKSLGFSIDDITLAPTFEDAFRWFRDNHLMFHEINVDKTTEPKFSYKISEYMSYEFMEGWRDDVISQFLYYKHEDAELNCLKELIELVKELEKIKNP